MLLERERPSHKLRLDSRTKAIGRDNVRIAKEILRQASLDQREVLLVPDAS
jgi:hypothetical protein